MREKLNKDSGIKTNITFWEAPLWAFQAKEKLHVHADTKQIIYFTCMHGLRQAHMQQSIVKLKDESLVGI